jgi:Yip1 domain
MANGAGGSITSFFTIWTEPRATIRRIVDTDPTRHVIALATIGPAISMLASEWSAALGGNINLPVFWPISVVVLVALSALFGVISLYLGGAVWRWSGSLLGGVASSVEVRAAIAWASVPGIAGALLLLIAILLGLPTPQVTGGMPQLDPAFYKIMTFEGVIGVWSFVILLKCMGEVHRFSAWRALAAGLIPPLIAVVTIGFMVFLFSALAGHH